MSNTLGVGALFMQAGTLIPRSLEVETGACSPGWRWITNLDGDSFDRKVRNAGWSFFFLAAKIQVMVWGHWTDKLVGKAIKRVLARARPAQFNCLEVTELSARRFCGITSTSQPIRGASRKVQCCPALRSGNELTLLPHGLWDEVLKGRCLFLPRKPELQSSTLQEKASVGVAGQPAKFDVASPSWLDKAVLPTRYRHG